MPFSFYHLEQACVMEILRHLIQLSGVEAGNLYFRSFSFQVDLTAVRVGTILVEVGGMFWNDFFAAFDFLPLEIVWPHFTHLLTLNPTLNSLQGRCHVAEYHYLIMDFSPRCLLSWLGVTLKTEKMRLETGEYCLPNLLVLTGAL